MSPTCQARPNSSRESSPASPTRPQKRQRRAFTPTSDDDDLVVPIAHTDDTDTPAPLIRQAVGFSSLNTNVSTYQAPPQPTVPYFLPGQAPPPPRKPRAPRKKKDQQFSSQTTKFKLATSHDTGMPAIDTRTRPRKPPPKSVPANNVSAGGTLQRTSEHHPCRPDAATPAPQTRPLRMVTLLIEDLRSGVPDPQLAEVRVPLKPAQDSEDGFWADAAEICDALQSGPSRIDGPAKVYTMRGKFRQFFMRLDQSDQMQVQSAYIGVSKERTLNVYVEAPLAQGQLPRPPPPTDNSGSDRGTTSYAEPTHRPTYSLVTREDQIERLSKSSYVQPQSTRYSPVSESGSYGHAQRHDQSYRRPLTPPIPGQLADTPEEKDEAIANYIRSHIENHPGWMAYMESKAKPQRVSELLAQYTFVEDRIRELCGRRTPAHWDGAPSCCVEKRHIWRVLKLDSKWGDECQETSILVAYYGKHGTRYQDPRVVDMIDDVSPPKANTIDRFLGLLRSVDESYTRNIVRGQFVAS